MKTLPQILSAQIIVADLAARTAAAERDKPVNPPPPPRETIALAPSADVPRRRLCYGGGENWNSQIVIAAGPCWFKICIVANKGAVDFWLFVCDNTEAATKPTLCPIKVPAGTTQSLDRTNSARFMQNGIYVCASTDPVIKTLITNNDAFFETAHEVDV